MRPEPTLARFVLRTLAWLPPCLAGWYAIAPWHGLAAGWGGKLLANAFSDDLVSGLEREGRNLEFVTRILVHPQPGTTGALVPEVNPLIYTFGLAFFVALMLASRARAWKILAGAALLLPFQAWSVGFDLLVQVAVRLGRDVAMQAGLLGWEREAIALCYQVGALLFPALAPVVLWGAFNRPFLERLLARGTPGPSR